MTEPPNGVQRDIGELKGLLRGLIDRVNDADESRRRMHERMNTQTEQMFRLTAQVSNLTDTTRDLVTVVAEVRGIAGRVEALERARKAVTDAASYLGSKVGGGLKWILIGIGTAFVAFWRELLELFNR